MGTKRQTTMAKLQRERRVQEKREFKREKKLAAAAAKLAGETPGGEETVDEVEADETSPPAE